MGTSRIVGVGVAALLVAACGGEDDDDGFCDHAVAFMEDATVFDDPSTDAAQAALEEADELDPPEVIADDWQILIDGARVLAEVDPDQTANLDELPDKVQMMGPASTNVFEYLAEECDVEVQP